MCFVIPDFYLKLDSSLAKHKAVFLRFLYTLEDDYYHKDRLVNASSLCNSRMTGCKIKAVRFSFFYLVSI